MKLPFFSSSSDCIAGLSLISEAIAMLKDVQTKYSSTNTPDNVSDDWRKVFSDSEILRISKLCTESLNILSHLLHMKAQVLWLPIGCWNFDPFLKWFDEIVEVYSMIGGPDRDRIWNLKCRS